VLSKMTHKDKSKTLHPELSEVSEDIFSDSKISASTPCFQPKGGFSYVYEWTTERKKGNSKSYYFFSCSNLVGFIFEQKTIGGQTAIHGVKEDHLSMQCQVRTT
jgi:hypothetical protein